ncbi:endo-1,4-beta-xylanase [Kineococcus radiotolerans]|uniref:Beta-xylanase n=1 Tax=Kineococcus radiotolerans TaxID=131568 RepID=A0A7W4TKZ0_KINRA|nr:endo-1,4-beta-xylanase [Kineococcus radiotolerans]MBB2900809.1 endo-1,4-beta-xylanase [Kineococcus radiotolerans]
MRLHRTPPTTTARRLVGLALAPTMLALAAAAPSAAAPRADAQQAQAQAAQRHGGQDTLRRAAPRDLAVGTAVAGGGHHAEQDYADPFAYDVEYRERMAAEFSSLSPENQAKWEYIHPRRDFYNFYPMDAIVRFAEENRQVVRGHTLFWHSQNPEWLEQGDFTDEELRAILKEHIQTVVGRYAGRVQQWDVANEIVRDDGSGLRVGPTSEGGNIWITRLGEGIIADAFRWAHEADPRAKLFFNDYGVEGINAKSTYYYELVQDLKAQGVPVDGFAIQGHLSTQYGFPGDLQANLQRFDALGLETAVTELDVRMVLPENGIPTSAQQAQQADYYRRTLQACLAVEECNSFTIWGFTDTYSWVPVFFAAEGSATVMTDDYERKPAYYALQSTLRDARRGGR